MKLPSVTDGFGSAVLDRWKFFSSFFFCVSARGRGDGGAVESRGARANVRFSRVHSSNISVSV